MYGACESLEDDDNQHIVHNLLRRYKIWNGQADAAKKYLDKQIVVALEDDADEDEARETLGTCCINAEITQSIA